MSVCSLDKLASIDIPAGKNSGIFGLLAESVTETAPVLWVKVWVRVWSSDRMQSSAEFNIATWHWACGFFFRSQLPHYLRYLAPEANHEMRAIAPQKILAFLLGTLIFYPYKFSGTEPSNFCVRGVELLIRLVLLLWLSDMTVARQLVATLDADLLPQMQQHRVEAPNGENRILQRPFRL